MATNLSGVGHRGSSSNLAPAANVYNPATNLSGSHRPTTNSMRESVEHFFDEEIIGEMEKHEIMGVPMTRRISIGILICFAISAIVLGIGFGAMIDGSKDESASSSSDGIPDEERYEALMELIEPLVGPSVRDETSHEHAALQWMADYDPLKLSMNSHIDELSQRFVLVTLYEATNGPKWTAACNFKSHKSVCDWNMGKKKELGVYCTNGVVTRLNFDDHGMDGTLPIGLGLLTHLQDLNMEGNYLRGHLPSSLGLLQQLTHLDMHANLLTGFAPGSAGKLHKLEYLFLYRNEFTGSIPHEYVAELDNLKEINLSFNKFTHVDTTGMDAFFDRESLVKMDLSHNELKGSLPRSYRRLPDLEVLNLSNNQFTGELSAALAAMPKLKEFDISGNQLTGSVPQDFGQEWGLEIFRAADNDLIGEIPERFSWLDKNLGILDLSGNGFTGTIPTEFGRLTELQIFKADHNKLNGPIPSEMGEMYALLELNLAHNMLEDRIPKELGRLGNVEQLYLQHNRLEASLPSEFADLRELKVFEVTNNFLFGDLDAVLCNRPSAWAPFEIIEADCLQEDLTCTCCTKCCDGKDHCCENGSSECGSS